MRRKTLLYIYTFLGVGLTIFFVGFAGINVSLRYIEKKYITLQLDVNKRQAQSMARILESELASGLPLDTVQNRFQRTIEGTEFDRGFMCMFNTHQAKLVCHPNASMVGLTIPNDFTFNTNLGNDLPAAEEMKKTDPIAGIFVQGSMRTDIAYLERVKGTPWRIASHQNITLIRKELDTIRRNYIWGSLILGLILAFGASFIARRISRRYELEIEDKNMQLTDSYSKLKDLHEEVQTQKEEIELQRDIVTAHRDQIAKQKKDIVDSITYARQIQLALLPTKQQLEENLPAHFVFYRPKDIISGDFYWSKTINQTIYLTVADCTGHGVPGAFMSLLGITLLSDIVGPNTSSNPAEILNELRVRVKNALKQNEKEVVTRDGMDITMVAINLHTKQIQYAGAYNPLILIRKGEIVEIKGDRMPIGIHIKEQDSFTNHTFDLISDDTFYLYSDGFADQSGGESGKKFMSKNLKQLLATAAAHPIAEQLSILDNTLTSWMANTSQVDDITILGFKVD